MYLYVFDLPFNMGKTRISIKLNDYEYSLLYKIQTSCTMTGLLYNRAPQLNEIIKGLILFVALNVSQTHENLDMFFRTIKTDSEYPEDTLDMAVNIPKNAGNYIFIADENDMELLHKIGDITERIYHEKYDMPKLIRYCLHYSLYGNRSPLSENLLNDRKYKFILPVIIGNFYYLSPRTAIKVFYDPLINPSNIEKKEYEFLRQVPLDEETYKNTIKLLGESIFHISEVKKYTLSSETQKTLGPGILLPPELFLSLHKEKLYRVFINQKKEFNSNVSDFNFLSTLIGLLEVIYMWYIDSFNYSDVSLIFLLSSFNIPKDLEKLSLREKYEELRGMIGLFPPILLNLSFLFLEPLEKLFNQFLYISKKIPKF